MSNGISCEKIPYGALNPTVSTIFMICRRAFTDQDAVCYIDAYVSEGYTITLFYLMHLVNTSEIFILPFIFVNCVFIFISLERFVQAVPVSHIIHTVLSYSSCKCYCITYIFFFLTI